MSDPSELADSPPPAAILASDLTVLEGDLPALGVAALGMARHYADASSGSSNSRCEAFPVTGNARLLISYARTY